LEKREKGGGGREQTTVQQTSQVQQKQGFKKRGGNDPGGSNLKATGKIVVQGGDFGGRTETPMLRWGVGKGGEGRAKNH